VSGNRNCCYAHIGVHLIMKIDHVAYVHTVDMVGAKDRYQMSIQIIN